MIDVQGLIKLALAMARAYGLSGFDAALKAVCLLHTLGLSDVQGPWPVNEKGQTFYVTVNGMAWEAFIGTRDTFNVDAVSVPFAGQWGRNIELAATLTGRA